MKIKIRYEAQARRACGMDEETIDLSTPCRVSDCIQHIAEQHAGTLGPMIVNEAGGDPTFTADFSR